MTTKTIRASLRMSARGWAALPGCEAVAVIRARCCCTANFDHGWSGRSPSSTSTTFDWTQHGGSCLGRRTVRRRRFLGNLRIETQSHDRDGRPRRLGTLLESSRRRMRQRVPWTHDQSCPSAYVAMECFELVSSPAGNAVLALSRSETTRHVHREAASARGVRERSNMRARLPIVRHFVPAALFAHGQQSSLLFRRLFTARTQSYDLASPFQSRAAS